MSIQTINTTNRTKGVGYTRYILSEKQRNLLFRIRTWMKNYPLKIDGRKESIRFITTILDKDGYDEWDRNQLLSIRSKYITYIEQ